MNRQKRVRRNKGMTEMKESMDEREMRWMHDGRREKVM